MATNKILQTFGVGQTPGQSTTTWNVPAQQITILDTTNPQSLRTLVVSNQGVRMFRGQTAAGMLIADIAKAMITLEPSIAVPPYFTVQPVNTTVTYNGGTSFPATVGSEIAATYQWQLSTDGGNTWNNLINAGVYSGVTTTTLSITIVNGLHGYEYRLAATNAIGVTNSAVARLTVVPQITVQPTNQSVVHPATATFSVTTAGTATINYAWQQSIDGGNTWTAATGGTNSSSYTTPATTLGMNGYQYRVIVTDGNGQSTTSNAATLTVT